MPVDSLATIRALANAITNQQGQVKLVKDGFDKFEQGTQTISQAVNSQAQTTSGALSANTQEINKIWSKVRRHIAEGATAMQGTLATVSANTRRLTGIGIFSSVSEGAVVNDSRSNPYAAMVMTAGRMVNAGTKINDEGEIEVTSTALVIAGFVFMGLAFGATVGVLGTIAGLETQAYNREAAAGRNALGTLARLINRSNDLGQGDKKDHDIFRDVMFNGQGYTQYDGDPAIGPNGDGNPRPAGAPYDNRWLQN